MGHAQIDHVVGGIHWMLFGRPIGSPQATE
jgi:hypothetical protein